MKERAQIVDEKKTSAMVHRLAEELSAEFFRQTDKEIALFKALSASVKSMAGVRSAEQVDVSEVFKKYNLELRAFLKDAAIFNDQLEVKDCFRSYVKELEVYISTLPVQHTFEQEDARFLPAHTDSFQIRIFKRLKGFVRGIQIAGRPLISLIRKLGGKPKVGMPIWKHNAAVRQVFRYSLRNVLLEDIFPSFEEALKQNNVFHSRFSEMEYLVSQRFLYEYTGKTSDQDPRVFYDEFVAKLQEIEADVAAAKDYLTQAVEASGMHAMEAYYHLEKISGTIEYPEAKSAVRVINRQFSKLLTALEHMLHSYGNTRHFIFDDWSLDTALNGLSTTLLAEKSDILYSLEDKYKADIDLFVKSYSELLVNIRSELKEKGTSTLLMKKLFRSFKSDFTSLLIETLSSIKSKSLAARIRNISRTLSSEIGNYPESNVFIRKFDPADVTMDKEILTIRPADILRFEIMPELESDLSTLSSDALLKLEGLFNQMTETGSIADFSIESALKQILDKHVGEKDPEATLLEGLARSEEKLQFILSSYAELKELVGKELSDMVQSLLAEIEKLKESEAVFSLNVRVARVLLKRRLSERSIAFRKKLKQGSRSAILVPARLFRRSFSKAHGMLSKVVKTSSPGAISAELSAYLSESKNAIARLPYIYQRLYLIKPLENELYFYSRTKETSSLDAAIASWENKHYSSLALLSEKGSGLTSFINNYRKAHKKYPVVQIGSFEQLYSKEDFLTFLSRSLGLKSSNEEGVVNELNEGEERIIFLEDLQNLYLRTVDGFNSLKTFFSIMSLSNEKVLWICSCTKYAWEYLELSLNISGYFNTVVQLTQLDASAIRELILKRHIISGYSIKYDPNKIQANSRQYKKIPIEERQVYLEDQYFANMNRFAKGNVSLALHFWLRSTKEVQDKQIIISSIYDSDYSFLSTLTRDHLVILTMICLHDAVNALHLSRIMRKPLEESKRVLNTLYDDSIVVKRDDYYLINPLLYRQLVEFLKDKNFIQ